jgi:hypothetical protein
MDFTASSAVNLPIGSASLRLDVISMGGRSIRRTYSVLWVPPRFTFTTNLVFFMFFTASIRCRGRLPKNGPVLNPGRDSVVVDASSLHNTPVRCWKELKEVLTTHEHRNSLVRNPEFPSSHEACTQSLFEGHWNYGYGRSEHTHDHQMEVFLSPKPTSSRLFSR